MGYGCRFFYDHFLSVFPQGVGGLPTWHVCPSVGAWQQLHRDTFLSFYQLAWIIHFTPHSHAPTVNTAQVWKGDFLAIWG